MPAVAVLVKDSIHVCAGYYAEQAGKSVDESIEAMRETMDEGLEDAKDAIEETKEKIE